VLFRSYDEDKALIGFASREDARRAYLRHYTDPRFYGPVTAIPIEKFRKNVLEGKYQRGERIAKAEWSGEFHGAAGLISINRPVGTMGNYGEAARTASRNTIGLPRQTDHPASPEQRTKDERRRRRRKSRKTTPKREAVDKIAPRDLGWNRPGAIEMPDPKVPRKERAARTKQIFADEMERRTRARDLGRLTVPVDRE
jgi:hypothetical protein